MSLFIKVDLLLLMNEFIISTSEFEVVLHIVIKAASRRVAESQYPKSVFSPRSASIGREWRTPSGLENERQEFVF